MPNPEEISVLKDFLDTFGGRETFQKSPAQVKVLKRVVSATIAGETTTAEQIRSEFYPDSDVDVVYPTVYRIKKSLDALYETEGRAEAVKVDLIYRGLGWIAAVEPNRPKIRDPLQFFWAKYLGSMSRNIIVFSEPLFHRRLSQKTDKRVYIRHVGVNSTDDRNRRNPLLRVLKDPKFRHKWTPSYHFVSAGEVFGMFTLVQDLSFGSAASIDNSRARDLQTKRMYVPIFRTEFRTPRMMPTLDTLPRSTNLIVLGNVRINRVYKQLQDECSFADYVLKGDCIEDRETGDRFEDEENSEYFVTYGLLTSVPELRHCGSLLIGGNSGRAIQGICEYLTDRKYLDDLCDRLAPRNLLASCFQVLFRITIESGGTHILRRELVDHKIYSEKAMDEPAAEPLRADRGPRRIGRGT
jgi:hypothetical protein